MAKLSDILNKIEEGSEKITFNDLSSLSYEDLSVLIHTFPNEIKKVVLEHIDNQTKLYIKNVINNS